MKIILDGNEVRDLFESYRYYVDPDSPVDFNDIVATINSRNKDFNELLYYTCMTILNWHSCQTAKLGLKSVVRSIGKQLMYTVTELKHAEMELPLLDVELIPGSFDVVITLATTTSITDSNTLEFIDPGADAVILDENGNELTES